MSKSTRRPQQIYSIVMWGLSIVFAGFLIGLGSLIIKDLPKADKTITTEQFISVEALEAADTRIDAAEEALKNSTAAHGIDQRNVNSARNDYAAAQDSLTNWLSARSATESSAQNPAVISRTRQVEALRDKQRAALRRLESAQESLSAARAESRGAKAARTALFDEARPAYRRAKDSQALRVFLYRLALTLPLLVIAGWLTAKQRASSYWPLYRGFVIFALFAFFIELVPYLPSYGGYVRYGVGLIMVVIIGHFVIRAMRRYLEKKQAEESRSEGERRQSIEYETALKKIAAKTCPGCDRSIVIREDIETDFCVHCGIRLKEKCRNCNERNISFHRFCLCCGEPAQALPQTHTDSAALEPNHGA